MLPLSLIKACINKPILVELKNNETYNGHLAIVDSFMNIQLKKAICTSKDGDKFWSIPEVYIKGNTIKFIRIPPDVIDNVNEEVKLKAPPRTTSGSSQFRGTGRGGYAGNQQGRGGGARGRGFTNRGGRGGRGGRGI